ncbi:hypothetical protein ISCGN_004191 [Ixodes scapularis]
MWTRLARDIGEKVDSARTYALPLAERRYLAYSVFCGRLWYLAQTALPTSRFIRPVKSALYSFFWSEKTELVTRPVVCLPRERGGWGFPCVDIAPAVLQLKTMLKILRDEHGPARSLALYFVGHSRRELGVESPSSPGPCAETPPSDYRRAIQLFKRLKERAPQLDVVETPTARLTEVLLEPQISATQLSVTTWNRRGGGGKRKMEVISTEALVLSLRTGYDPDKVAFDFINPAARPLYTDGIQKIASEEQSFPEALGAVRGVEHAIYADDITLWCREGNDAEIEERLQAAAKIVEDYAEECGLKCAPEKSELLVLRNPYERVSEEVEVWVSGKRVSKPTEIRILGQLIRQGRRNKSTIDKLDTMTTQSDGRVDTDLSFNEALKMKKLDRRVFPSPCWEGRRMDLEKAPDGHSCDPRQVAPVVPRPVHYGSLPLL